MERLALLLGLVAGPPSEAEARVVAYLKQNVRPGVRVVVSDLVNRVFTAPEERAVLDRLFNSFFKIPLFVAQYQRSAGRPPSLSELSEQFRFEIPGEADVLLRIMESDPRMPRFLARDPGSGEILRVDVEAILAHPTFGKRLERSIAGWQGRPAPAFEAEGYDGRPLRSQSLAGKPHLVYFWFSDCPPCLKTTPLLVELYRTYASRGFEIVAANADRLLELPFADADRAAYARRLAIPFALVHANAEMQEAYGAVSVFPTLFFVDADGVVVEHLVNFTERSVLDAALRRALGAGAASAAGLAPTW
jgi:thiol-disulfide isomerase/thioredoxin